MQLAGWLRLPRSRFPSHGRGEDVRTSCRKKVNCAPRVERLEDRCLLSGDLTPYVNPFIGTNPAPTAHYGFSFDSGDTFPGATTPEGMVQFSPDTLTFETASALTIS
jgi:hypothetical protein